MEITNEKKYQLARNLAAARTRILCNNGFYGLLIMHLPFALDDSIQTAATDGKRIYFNPDFLDKLTGKELDFVLLHELLHVVLRHLYRSKIFDENSERANIACDIVVNSNILLSKGMNLDSISIGGEPFMHLAPNGREGYYYTAEEVYEMLEEIPLPGISGGDARDDSATTTKNVSGGNSRSKEAGKSRGSNKSNGGAGGSHSKEKSKGAGRCKGNSGAEGGKQEVMDDHSKWEKLSEEEKQEIQEQWDQNFRNAIESISVKEHSKTYGNLPLFAQRILKELKKPQTDWRTILNEFCQIEILDYTFSPPDRRYDDSDFFLPDLNTTYDIGVSKLLFMVDTSGSITDNMLTTAYSEIRGAIEQFDGKIEGRLGFFDAAVVPAVPFVDAESLLKIVPRGGGGTNFHVIFDYVDTLEEKPGFIIILTDGEAPIPDEEMAKGIPVLWLIIGDGEAPEWGKVARVSV